MHNFSKIGEFILVCFTLLVASQFITHPSMAQTREFLSIVDGKLIIEEFPEKEVVEAGEPLQGVESTLEMLKMIEASSGNVSLSIVTPNGITIERDKLFGGFVQVDSTSDFNKLLTSSEPFSNVLELTPDQITEIKKIRMELIEELKLKTSSKDDQTKLHQLLGEMNVEFSRRLMRVLLPFQHKALIRFSVESMGVLPSISRLSAGNVLESNIDAKNIKDMAIVQLDRIETTVLKLKKDLANEIVSLLSPDDRKKMEMALESGIEDSIVNAPLGELQKQLEFVKNGGVPKFATLREFAEKLSQEDGAQSPIKPK